MAIAGYKSLVTCATGSGATFSALDGIKSFAISDSRDELDVTDFLDGGNVRARLSALRDVSLELSGDFEPSDTGYAKLRACYDNGTDVAVIVYASAEATTAAFQYLMKIGNIDINAAVDGKAEVSISMMINSSSGTSTFVHP